jgi:hypothetical protein
MPYVETSSDADESRDMHTVTSRIVDQLEQPQIEDEVSSAVEAEFRRFESARVREFVPVFVERRVRADLRALR